MIPNIRNLLYTYYVFLYRNLDGFEKIREQPKYCTLSANNIYSHTPIDKPLSESWKELCGLTCIFWEKII